MTDPVLSIRNLNIDYIGAEKDFHAVKDVSFDIAPGEFFGLAGESGCGKSTIAFAVSRLHRPLPSFAKAARSLSAAATSWHSTTTNSAASVGARSRWCSRAP